MALTLSLFQRPGGVLFLDDDPDYLDMLGMVVPAQTQVELYARPAGFLARMQAEPAHWEADPVRPRVAADPFLGIEVNTFIEAGRAGVSSPQAEDPRFRPLLSRISASARRGP